MTNKLVNNFSTTLNGAITDVATTLTLTSITGLSVLTAGDKVRMTLAVGTIREIVLLTYAAATSTFTVARGQDNTTAVAWDDASRIEARITAASINERFETALTSAAGLGCLDTDGTLVANSDTKIPSQKAVKTYVDTRALTFKTVAVSGQSDVVADAYNDTLTLAAGTGITLTTNASTDTVTIAGTSSTNTFGTIAVSGQSDIVADSTTDTLTIAAGSNITLTTNASTDTLTIAATGGSSRDRDAKTDISTSGGTTTFTSSSTFQQRWTGSTAGDIGKMPVTSTLSQGYQYLLINDATVSVAIQSSGANAILSIPGGSAVLMTCIDTSVTTAAGWTYTQLGKLGGVFYPFRLNTGNITLTGSSAFMQYYEDSGAVNNTMPVASTLVNGQSWLWVNKKSSGDVTIYASDNTTVLLIIPVGYKALFTCKDNTGGTGATPWIWDLSPINIKGNKPIIQTAFTTTGTMASGTTTLPLDNTTPQNTEGDEYMTLSITPTNSSNILEIDVLAYVSNSANEATQLALFQDSTANCLKSATQFGGVNFAAGLTLKHRMTAGTTSSTTFKVRIGRTTAGTVTFNGYSATSYLNGTLASYIKITEYQV